MLVELRVQNLLLIERAELSLDPGLNVITGETGAGKTVLAHALDLLLGGKPRRNVVRPGSEEAYVEGVFALPDGIAHDPDLAELAERIPLDGSEAVLARRVTTEGRTRAYLQGRSASAPELRALGTRLLAFYGQHEHRKLTVASAQLEILDGFCGGEHVGRRERFGRILAEARGQARELEELGQRLGVRERDLDLLEWEIGEIENVAPEEGEDDELERRRGRLAALETLRGAARAAAEAIDSEGDGLGGGASGALAHAEAELARAGGHDERLDELAGRLGSVAYDLQDLGRELRRYEEALEAEPGALAAIEERLDQLARLKRKHGGTIQSVLEHAERCRAERDRLQSAGQTTARLEAELAAARTSLEQLARELRAERERGAGELGRAVGVELAELGMADATFEVKVSGREHPADGSPLDGYTGTGDDVVEFAIAPNAGVAPGPLREVASGGELSRVMLALMNVATAAEGLATVVFDEVDAGVGGATARSVGQKLRALAASRQVICITHLPQVASQASRHFRVVKRTQPTAVESGDGASMNALATRADVDQLARTELVEELCRMLGSTGEDRAARRHAEQLLRAA